MPKETYCGLNRNPKPTPFIIMSPTSVHLKNLSSVNDFSNQASKKPSKNQKSSPISNSTETHTQVQQEQAQNSQTNPLTSAQQSSHNRRMVTGGV